MSFTICTAIQKNGKKCMNKIYLKGYSTCGTHGYKKSTELPLKVESSIESTIDTLTNSITAISIETTSNKVPLIEEKKEEPIQEKPVELLSNKVPLIEEKKEEPIESTNSSSTNNIMAQHTSTTFLKYLEQCSKDAIKENDDEMLIAIDNKDKDVIKRIENHRREKMTEEEQLSHTVDSILESLKTNTILRSFFRKDPTRQTLHEKAQIDWIRMYKYPDVYKMNADTNGICFSKNKIHKITKTTPRPSDATKTIDIHIPSKKTYAFLKHTSVPGGAQDNQFNDVKQFIIQVVGYLTENTSAEEQFEFYLDGKYYTEKKKNELHIMIPDTLKNRIIITSCEEILPTA